MPPNPLSHQTFDQDRVVTRTNVIVIFADHVLFTFGETNWFHDVERVEHSVSKVDDEKKLAIAVYFAGVNSFLKATFHHERNFPKSLVFLRHFQWAQCFLFPFFNAEILWCNSVVIQKPSYSTLFWLSLLWWIGVFILPQGFIFLIIFILFRSNLLQYFLFFWLNDQNCVLLIFLVQDILVQSGKGRRRVAFDKINFLFEIRRTKCRHDTIFFLPLSFTLLFILNFLGFLLQIDQIVLKFVKRVKMSCLILTSSLLHIRHLDQADHISSELISFGLAIQGDLIQLPFRCIKNIRFLLIVAHWTYNLPFQFNPVILFGKDIPVFFWWLLLVALGICHE